MEKPVPRKPGITRIARECVTRTVVAEYSLTGWRGAKKKPLSPGGRQGPSRRAGLEQVLRAYPEQGFVVPAVGLRRAAIGAPSDRGFASPTAHGNAGADACPGDAAEVLAGLPGMGGNFYPARVIKRERGDSACRVADFHLRQPAPVTVAFAHRVGPHASGSAQTEVFGRIQVVVGPLAAETAKQAPARRHGLQARNVKIQLAVVPRRVRAQAVGGGQIAVQLQGARRPGSRRHTSVRRHPGCRAHRTAPRSARCC